MAKETSQTTWGTWEELLLACAVKRHGFKNWDSVALELQTKTSLPSILTTAENCQQKYHDLNRRFTTTTTTSKEQQRLLDQKTQPKTESMKDKVNNIPWLEELRKLRVAELKQEVQRYDVSILSLQLKVKRLEEEHHKSLQDIGTKSEKEPDLKENNGKGPENRLDHENGSVNESNSTSSDGKTGAEENVAAKLEGVELVQAGSGEREPVLSGSNSKSGVGVGVVGTRGEESCELGESVTQLSGESQSSASLGSRRKEVSGADGMTQGSVKSEPLAGLLEIIRAHKNNSPLFESLLQNQETEVYKNMVRQHVDLEIIQTRLEQGSYSSSNLSFYRDLLLLFNNAIVFFPKSADESLTACELRSLVSNEMRKETQKSDSTIAAHINAPSQPKNELVRSDSLLAKHKSAVPIIVCRKRSSISSKPSASSLMQKIEPQQQQSNDDKPASDLKPPAVEQSLLKMKSEEKPVTGARSSRRSNKNLTKVTSTSSKKQNTNLADTKLGAADKPETPKTNKKKAETLALEKKRSAADFLKRIKKNSPMETVKKNTRVGDNNGGGERKKDSSQKGGKGKERMLRKNGDKKQPKEESSPSKRSIGRPSKKGLEASSVLGKRGREGGKEAMKRPRKQSRR